MRPFDGEYLPLHKYCNHLGPALTVSVTDSRITCFTLKSYVKFTMYNICCDAICLANINVNKVIVRNFTLGLTVSELYLTLKI